MAQQQQMVVVDFIEKVKRRNAKRQNPYLYDDTTPISTNRGNKLNRNAQFVHHGRLNNTPIFRQRIEHAGYQRNIISVNPPYYTPEGDIIENESEIDEDDEMLEENIYKDIKLEELLAPLTSAADLPTHPSLSIPYKDKGLPEMIQKAEDQLQQEQRILWKMKALFTELRGDAIWAPVGMFHSEVDNLILGTHRSSVSPTTFSGDATAVPVPTSLEAQNIQSDDVTHGGAPVNVPTEDKPMADDVLLQGSVASSTMNNGQPRLVERSIQDIPQISDGSPQVAVNGDRLGAQQNGKTSDGGDVRMVESTDPITNENLHSPSAEDNESSNGPSHRMTTRAQANQTTRSPSLVHSLSPSPQPTDPFFTFPATAIPNANLGLPSQMADETRVGLASYISKQEEIVRSFRDLHEGLLRAMQMRKNVWDWTKAEGHLDEMSDHEDWIDLEEWGIDFKDFTKGRHEDEGDEEDDKRVKRVNRRPPGRAAKD